jgi:predicted nucleic acid-binding protein
MGSKFLIDTNIIIYLALNKLPNRGEIKMRNILRDTPQISVITKMELLGFSEVQPPIIQFTETANIIGLEDEVIRKTIEIRKQYKIKLPDAIIAATSIVKELTLITRNISDFSKIIDLNTYNPFEE